MFYDIFERLCQERGVTPTKAGRDNGIKQGTVAMWKKRGTTPGAATVAKLAEYFGVRVEQLLSPQAEGEMQAVLQAVHQYAPGQADDYHSAALDMVLQETPFQVWWNAQEQADKAALDAYCYITEDILKQALLDSFYALNKRGKIEAVERLRELEEMARYTAPQGR